jgi:tetratricopeptide (TPR) repeat protein
MKKRLLFLTLTLLAAAASAQGYHDKFTILTRQHDTTGIKKLLIEWEKVNPGDPELYVSAVNFYFSNSSRTTASLGREQSGKLNLQLKDSTGRVAGYLNSDQDYRADQLALALKYIDKGIGKFPNRLDMRFGKCYVLEQVGDYDRFTAELIRTVEYSTQNKNNWLWTNNQKKEDGEHFMLETIQHYLKELYDTENDSLLENIRQIGEVTIKYYPNNIEILSTTAVANMLTKNYDLAIGYLKRAEKLNPKDFIVLNNLASGYKLKGDTANAIKYFELTAKYGDEEAKQSARRNIRELKH